MDYTEACDRIAEHGLGTIILSEGKVYSNMFPHNIYRACLSTAKRLSLYEDTEEIQEGTFIESVHRMEKVMLKYVDVEDVYTEEPFVVCCVDNFGMTCYVKSTDTALAVYHLMRALSIVEQGAGPMESFPHSN